MFTAIILACWLHSPQDCTQFVDTRGPYKTEGECSIRAVTMIREIRSMTPGKVIVGAHCSIIAEEST